MVGDGFCSEEAILSKWLFLGTKKNPIGTFSNVVVLINFKFHMGMYCCGQWPAGVRTIVVGSTNCLFDMVVVLEFKKRNG